VAKPDFTGTWVFNAAQSSLQIQAPDSATFVIDHRDSQFRLVRTLIMRGERDTLSIGFTTDGSPFELVRRGYEVRGRAYWEGDALAFDTTLARDGEQATNAVRYRLSDNGRTLTAEERFRGRDLSYDNVWVLDRQ
jgi:hypothetical protein